MNLSRHYIGFLALLISLGVLTYVAYLYYSEINPTFLVIIWVIAALALIEIFSRYVMDLHAPIETRPFEPIFTSGHLSVECSNKDLLNTRNSPKAYGYHYRQGFYYYNKVEPISGFSERSDFLYDHGYSCYPSKELNRICKTDKDGIKVIILGASAARGVSASDTTTTWYYQLEKRLRESFGREDIFLFNGAISGYSSTQERLAAELSACHKSPDAILILNGYNDITLPCVCSARPGDHYQTGVRYTQIYHPTVFHWFCRNSRALRFLYQKNIRKNIIAFREQIMADSEQRSLLEENIINVYRENVSAIFRRCGYEGIQPLVLFQPCKTYTLAKHSADKGEDLSDWSRFVYDLYGKMNGIFDSEEYKDRFADMSGFMEDVSTHEWYTDDVHINDTGQAHFAEYVFPAVKNMLEGITSK